MPVPYIFANVPGGTTIPLAELDANFQFCLDNADITSANIAGNATVGGMLTANGGLTINGAITVDGSTVNPVGTTGTGALVFNISPTLVTPILGTPTSGNLSLCTGYPVAQVAGLAAGVLPFLTNPTCANLAIAVVDETGTGNLVFSNNPVLSSPSLTTPILGTPQGGNLINCTSYPASGLSGVVPITIGGTGLSATGSIGQILAVTAANTLGYISAPPSVSVAGGLASQILYQSAPNTTAFIPNGTIGQVLTSQGPNPPVWGQLNLTSNATGVLPIANGGTAAFTQQQALNNLAGSVTNGNYLRGTGANVVMSPIILGDITALGTLSNNTTGSASTFTSTTQNSQFNSIGVNLAATGVAGEITSTGDIQTTTGFFTDTNGTLHPLIQGSSQTPAGSTVTFTAIPSWVNRITLMFYSVVTAAGSSTPEIRIGTSGGIVSTGYTSYCTWLISGAQQSTSGFTLAYNSPGTFNATFTINRVAGNQWICSAIASVNNANPQLGSGVVTLGTNLTQIQAAFIGAGTYTGGTMNILYE